MSDRDAKLIWEARFWPFKGKSKSLIKRFDKEVGDLSVDKDDDNLIGTSVLRSEDLSVQWESL